MSTQGWEVYISGCPHDLRQLTREARSNFFAISGGIDDWHDCPNDDFRLHSSLFARASNADELYAIASELMDLFSGATRLVGWYTPFQYKVDQIRFNGVQKSYSTNTCIGMPKNDGVSIIPIASHFMESLKVDIRYALVEMAFSNQDIWSILHYLKEPPTLASLSKVLDAIKGYSLKKTTLYRVDAKSPDHKSFSNTANNFSISFLDARHGYEVVREEKPNKTPVMTIDEAINYILSQTRAYLLSAYPILASGGKFAL